LIDDAHVTTPLVVNLELAVEIVPFIEAPPIGAAPTSTALSAHMLERLNERRVGDRNRRHALPSIVHSRLAASDVVAGT
jgi:hypothetical protein